MSVGGADIICGWGSHTPADTYLAHRATYVSPSRAFAPEVFAGLVLLYPRTDIRIAKTKSGGTVTTKAFARSVR